MCKLKGCLTFFITFGAFSAGAGLLQWGGEQQGAAACVTPYVAAPSKKACTNCYQKRGNPVWNQSECQWEQAECTGNKPLPPKCSKEKGYTGEFDQSTCQWQRADNTTCKECSKSDEDKPSKKACTNCWETRGEPEWNKSRCRWEQGECTGSKPAKPDPEDCRNCYQTRGEPEWSDTECDWEQSLCTGDRPGQEPVCASGNYVGDWDNSACQWTPLSVAVCTNDGRECSNNANCEDEGDNKICSNSGQCIDNVEQPENACAPDPDDNNDCKMPDGSECAPCQGERQMNESTCQCECPDGEREIGSACIAEGEDTCSTGGARVIGHTCNRESGRLIALNDNSRPDRFSHRCSVDGRCIDVTNLNASDFVVKMLKGSSTEDRLFCDANNNLKKRSCKYNKYSIAPIRTIRNLGQCKDIEDMGINSPAICNNCAVKYHSCIEDCQDAHGTCTLVRTTPNAILMGGGDNPRRDTPDCQRIRREKNTEILRGTSASLDGVHSRDCTDVCTRQREHLFSNCNLLQGLFNCPNERPYLKAIGQCVACITNDHCDSGEMCSTNNTCVQADEFNQCFNECKSCLTRQSADKSTKRSVCMADRNFAANRNTGGCRAYCDWKLNSRTCSNTICTTSGERGDHNDYCKCKNPSNFSPTPAGKGVPMGDTTPTTNPASSACQNLPTETQRDNCERAVQQWSGKAPFAAGCLRLQQNQRASCIQRLLGNINF